MLRETHSDGCGITGIECGSSGQSNGGVEAAAAAAHGVGVEGLEGEEWEKMTVELGRIKREKNVIS